MKVKSITLNRKAANVEMTNLRDVIKIICDKDSSKINNNKKWTKKEKDIIVSLKKSDKHITFQEIANKLEKEGYMKRTMEAVRGIWRRKKEKVEKKSKKRSKTVTKKTTNSKPSTYNLKEVMDGSLPKEKEYNKAIKDMSDIREHALKEHNEFKSRIGNPANNANIKVVSISDLHIPFYNEDVIKSVLQEQDVDILVVNGDFLELYSVSSWPKNKTIMLQHEYQMGMRLLREFSKVFPKVVLTKGNHEDRLQRFLSQNINPNVSFMTSPDVLERMSNGYDFDDSGNLVKMYNLDNVHYNKGPLSWQVQIGKCIFAHPTSFSKINMKTIANVAQSMLGKGYDFEALVIGHTHQQGSIIWNNRMLIEQGCSCIPMEYECNAKATYGSQSFGYAIVWMDKKGHVDFDKSGTVYCGTGTIIESKNNYSLED